MIPPFSIERTNVMNGTVLLRVRGELDARNAQVMVEESTRVLVAGQNLVLNLEGVSFIASSGIGALLALVEEFRRGPGSLRLAAISPPVDAVVRLLNLDRFLGIHDTEQAALEDLRDGTNG